jgi:hypothetical protein
MWRDIKSGGIERLAVALMRKGQPCSITTPGEVTVNVSYISRCASPSRLKLNGGSANGERWQDRGDSRCRLRGESAKRKRVD